MTTYRITAKWAGLTMTEDITVDTDMSPEDEIAHAEDVLTDKWCQLFGEEFVLNADEFTTESVS